MPWPDRGSFRRTTAGEADGPRRVRRALGDEHLWLPGGSQEVGVVPLVLERGGDAPGPARQRGRVPRRRGRHLQGDGGGDRRRVRPAALRLPPRLDLHRRLSVRAGRPEVPGPARAGGGARRRGARDALGSGRLHQQRHREAHQPAPGGSRHPRQSHAPELGIAPPEGAHREREGRPRRLLRGHRREPRPRVPAGRTDPGSPARRCATCTAGCEVR